MNKKLYIAYGINLNEVIMGWKCPGAKVVAKSWLHDYRLAFRGILNHSRATVIPAKGHDVPVVVWEISEFDEMALDRHEGIRGGHMKKSTMVIEVAGEMREAIIYTDPGESTGVPSDSYLELIVMGYKKFNLDIRALNDALIQTYQTTLSARAI